MVIGGGRMVTVPDYRSSLGYPSCCDDWPMLVYDGHGRKGYGHDD